MPDKTSRGLYFSETDMHFVCPWHGYEYDLKTGECVADRRLKLQAIRGGRREGTMCMSLPKAGVLATATADTTASRSSAGDLSARALASPPTSTEPWPRVGSIY